jgi:hypothetical protein
VITITVMQLRDLSACKGALDLFVEEFGDHLDIPSYTPQHQEYLVRSEWRRYLGFAWSYDILPQWSMRGAYLRGAYLSGAYLRGADLRGADLIGANLRGANLRGADLRGADLRGADLIGADLIGADLSGAYLIGADLSGADLSWANLSWALATSAPSGWTSVDGRLVRVEVPR